MKVNAGAVCFLRRKVAKQTAGKGFQGWSGRRSYRRKGEEPLTGLGKGKTERLLATGEANPQENAVKPARASFRNRRSREAVELRLQHTDLLRELIHREEHGNNFRRRSGRDARR